MFIFTIPCDFTKVFFMTFYAASSWLSPQSEVETYDHEDSILYIEFPLHYQHLFEYIYLYVRIFRS